MAYGVDDVAFHENVSENHVVIVDNFDFFSASFRLTIVLQASES